MFLLGGWGGLGWVGELGGGVAGVLLLIRLGLPGAGAQRRKLAKDKVAWADDIEAGKRSQAAATGLI
jgi:hypothetical protein